MVAPSSLVLLFGVVRTTMVTIEKVVAARPTPILITEIEAEGDVIVVVILLHSYCHSLRAHVLSFSLVLFVSLL